MFNKLNTHSLTGFANYAKQIVIKTYQDNCTIKTCEGLHMFTHKQALTPQTGIYLSIGLYVCETYIQNTVSHPK